MPVTNAQIAALSMVNTALIKFGDRVEAGVTALCQRYSQEGAAYAKENRPWKDHTNTARNSLHGYVAKDKAISARISHGVFYGIYLEKKYSGRYAVLPKVLRRYQAPFFEDLKKVFGNAVIGAPK